VSFFFFPRPCEELILFNLTDLLPLLFFSWIESYPWICDFTIIECIRGGNSFIYELIFGGIPLFLSFATITISMAMIYLFVRRRMHSMEPSQGTSLPAEKRQAAIQATLFVGALLLTYIISVSLSVSAMFGINNIHWALPMMQSILLPLQGFWNCIIFLRPYVLHIRQEYPRRTLFWVVKVAIFAPRSTRLQVQGLTSIDLGDIPSSLHRQSRSSLSIGMDQYEKEDKDNTKVIIEGNLTSKQSCNDENISIAENSNEYK